ncbi:ribosome recycling factor [Candidatus Parcubacteria bacterium]|nr:ribosome recycling factor [Candidatus Parcubacteria bacterium]
MAVVNTLPKITKTLQVLKDHLSQLRASRAAPSWLGGIEVAVYGTRMKLVEVASITSPDPQLLSVQPWDSSIIDDVVRAIESSNLGLNPLKEGAVVKVPVPVLSEERRQELVKVAGQRIEEARVAVRQIRQEAMRELDKLEEMKEIGEDEKFRGKKEIEQKIQRANEEIEEIGQQKKAEILAI